MQLSSPTVLAVTSLTWPRRGPTSFPSSKMLGTRTNTACSSVRGPGLGPGGGRTGRSRFPGCGLQSPDLDGIGVDAQASRVYRNGKGGESPVRLWRWPSHFMCLVPSEGPPPSFLPPSKTRYLSHCPRLVCNLLLQRSSPSSGEIIPQKAQLSVAWPRGARCECQ